MPNPTPAGAARKAARAAGEKTFIGVPCVHCGGTIRATTNNICPPCHATRARARHEKNPDVRRACSLRIKFGISLAEWDNLVAEQDGACAICREPLRRGLGGACVDHCHRSGAVRRILCSPCNKGLGFFRDNSTALRAAADYIDQHASADAGTADR